MTAARSEQTQDAQGCLLAVIDQMTAATTVAPNTSRLLQRLAGLLPLSPEQSRALQEIAGPARLYRPHEDLAREGHSAGHIGLLIERHPRVGQALCWLAMVEELIAREWLVNVGQRTAIERLAHLLCEIFARMKAVGLTDGGRCGLPLTQVELADSLALSTVHVNRTLQELHRQGLVSLSAGMLEIHDFEALQAIAIFSADYLQPGHPESGLLQRRLSPR